MYTLQDYSLISTHVQKFKRDYEIQEDSVAFYFFVLDLILSLSESEARDAITDTYYLRRYAELSGHDRGIDAVYVDNDTSPATVHFFNFKYAMTFEKGKGFIESNEIDKIEGFLNRLMLKELDLKSEVNAVLYSKVQEIWELFGRENPNLVVHIASNYEKGFEPLERTRFEKGLKKFANVDYNYILAEKIVDQITNRHRKRIDAKIRAIDLNLFEKGDGSIRALITNLDARDVIRSIVDDDAIRNNPEFADYDTIKYHKIAEDAFEDNVRLYLKKETRINSNIVETALSDENYRFFYFNNGITITCDHFSYPKGRRTPIIEIQNLQVVNGSQTLHALYEAMVKDSDKIANVNLLCRIYETKDKELSSRIAEYTNSQNPVNNRDIHSIDALQIKLEKEFHALGYYYERKRNQHSIHQKSLRIDAEKLGQAILALFGEQPSEAKNHKRKIFDDYYDDVFTNELCAEQALFAYRLFEYIEEKKTVRRKEILQNYDSLGYLSYASYWILFVFSKMSKSFGVELSLKNLEFFISKYPQVDECLAFFAAKEREKKGESYSPSSFFKYNQVKRSWEDYADDVQRILGA